jgi:hypothetical protein
MNNAKNNEQPKPNEPRQQQNKPKPSGRQPQAQKNPWAAYQQPQKKQQKSQTRKTQKPQVNEILEKAKENSNYSRIKEEPSHEHHDSDHAMNHDTELSNQPGVDDFDTYHLMEEVNDLIVKGYDGNLEFERDFLAEATDMLNRITVTP